MIGKLNGTLPKVGIRPIIDGRREGVRECLEVQTMNMAKSVADLISELYFIQTERRLSAL